MKIKITGFPSYLDSTVAPVSHNDVVIVVDSYARRGVELPVPFTVVAKCVHKLPVGVEHLITRLNSIKRPVLS